MHAYAFCFAIALSGTAVQKEPDARTAKWLKGDHYRIKWGTPKVFEPTVTQLEIGDGEGHGFTLGWLRFQPDKDGVDVLSIQYDAGYKPYKSKWQPDDAPVVIKHARMKLDAYKVLIADLAIVDSAELSAMRSDSKSYSTFRNFFVGARLLEKGKTVFDLEWAGYQGSSDEVRYAKPNASVILARAAVKKLEFKDHELTDKDREWASAKFIRDWKTFEKSKSHWWVKERYIITIGVVGDKSAIPTLRDITAGDPKERDVYYAINAITRLIKKDVREKPIEEMDVEKTRKAVLALIKDVK
jgi:hypothetical protein